MSKALSSSESKIDQWLRMRIDRPPEKEDAKNSPAQLENTNSVKSLKELLETIANSSEWSSEIEQSLDDLGPYFLLPKDWWRAHEEFDDSIKREMVAAFADSWIYRQWLASKDQNAAQLYADFFSQTVMHPEWIKAVQSMHYHYFFEDGNFNEVIPTLYKFIFPECLEDSPWQVRSHQKIGGELDLRAVEASVWMGQLFRSDSKDRSKLLESGLDHICLATLKGDTDFFIHLGKALSEDYKPLRKLPLEEIQNLPTSRSRKEPTMRQWCRRIWISRGFWLIPKHFLLQKPFSLSKTAINELVGKTYNSKKSLPQNDGLFQVNSPWLNELQGNSKTGSLTIDGKKALPNFVRTGFPWLIVSADFE